MGRVRLPGLRLWMVLVLVALAAVLCRLHIRRQSWEYRRQEAQRRAAYHLGEESTAKDLAKSCGRYARFLEEGKFTTAREVWDAMMEIGPPIGFSGPLGAFGPPDPTVPAPSAEVLRAEIALWKGEEARHAATARDHSRIRRIYERVRDHPWEAVEPYTPPRR